MCHCLHLAVGEGARCEVIQQTLRDLAVLTAKLKKSPKEWAIFRGIQVDIAVRAKQCRDGEIGDDDESEDGGSEDEQGAALEKKRPGSVLKLLTSVPTRWSSVFYCVNRALRLRRAIDEYLNMHPLTVKDTEDEDDTRGRRVDKLEWETLEALKDAMSPIRDVSLMLEGHNYVTSSTVLLYIVRLMYGQLDLKSQGRTASYRTFVRAFTQKLSTLIDDVNQFYTWSLAAYVDGRHKSLEWLKPIWAHKEHWPKVIKEYKNLDALKRNLHGEIEKMVSLSLVAFRLS